MVGGEQVFDGFVRQFGVNPQVVAVAPGRVNLIGEHTDYNGGFVFPAAIDRQLYVAASITDGSTQTFSEELGAGTSFAAASVGPGEIDDWSKYAAGVAWALRERGSEPSNILAYVASDVPIGSGISSSAAIELAFGVAWNHLDHLGLEPKALAIVGQRCENGFIGLNSGIMDQVASALGKRDCAIFLDTRTLDIEYSRIPEGLAIVLCDTGKPRALTDSAYNERRSQCEAAAAVMGVPALRDADEALLQRFHDQLEPKVYKRALHVVTENERCRAFRRALETFDVHSIGNLMRASHESLRDDYEVSSRELDAMAESAWAAPGCVGARMTGAGFGGACVALVQPDRAEEFVEHAQREYQSRVGLSGLFLPCKAVDGAHVVFGAEQNPQ